MVKKSELQKPLRAGMRKDQRKPGLPSGADLDAVAEERRIAEATKGPKEH